MQSSPHSPQSDISSLRDETGRILQRTRRRWWRAKLHRPIPSQWWAVRSPTTRPGTGRKSANRTSRAPRTLRILALIRTSGHRRSFRASRPPALQHRVLRHARGLPGADPTEGPASREPSATYVGELGQERPLTDRAARNALLDALTKHASPQEVSKRGAAASKASTGPAWPGIFVPPPRPTAAGSSRAAKRTMIAGPRQESAGRLSRNRSAYLPFDSIASFSRMRAPRMMLPSA